jgi:hypothetical protein
VDSPENNVLKVSVNRYNKVFAKTSEINLRSYREIWQEIGEIGLTEGELVALFTCPLQEEKQEKVFILGKIDKS